MLQNFRIYLAVGGMPQAVEAFINKKTFSEIDDIKKGIIALYQEDLMKIDKTSRTSKLFESIPSQLVSKKNKFSFGFSLKKKTDKDNERLFDLCDSKIVNICHNLLDVSPSLKMYEDLTKFKLYVADTGLFVTMLFNSGVAMHEDIYRKLLSDHLSMNLGYLFENMVSQIIVSQHINLHYFTFKQPSSKNQYEIDFIFNYRDKVVPLEVKSSKLTQHVSLDKFFDKYSKSIYKSFIISTKDFSVNNNIINLPIYFLPLLLEELKEKKLSF